MFRYENSMRVYNEEKYPYSMEYVKESRYENYHGICSKDGFCIMAAGSKHLFCTPEMSDFSLKMNVYIDDKKSSKVLKFAVMFGYNKAERSGYEIEFAYKENTLYIALVSFVCNNKTRINEIKFDNVNLLGKAKLLRMYLEKGCCRGFFGKCGFEFKTESFYGKTGIDVSSVYAGVTFSDVKILSKEKYKKELVYSKKFEFLSENGGFIPYTIFTDIYKYGGIYEMKYRLEGGISSREETNLYADVWGRQFDDITEPYIKLISGKEIKKYSFYNDSARFIDSNCSDYLRTIYGNVYDMRETPLEGNFFINDFSENMIIGFGYEYFAGYVYQSMSGGYEYIFNKEDLLLYEGEPLNEKTVMRFKSINKKIAELLPEKLYKYDDAVVHAKRNHYFYTDEIPSFELEIYSKNNFEKIRIYLLDAFFNKIREVSFVKTAEESEICGFYGKKYRFELSAIPCGVYHISADLMYGDTVVDNHYSAFEVMEENSDKSPQAASNLPVLYVGDGAPALTESGVPDFYTRKSEFDWGHYCNIGLYVPISAQKMRIWEISEFYKRKVFTWITKRTVRGYDVTLLDDIIKNAEYNNYMYPGLEENPQYYRFDFYDIRAYSTFVREKLNEFFKIHPEYDKVLGINDATERFDKDDLLKLLRLCGNEWMDFGLAAVKENFAKQSAKLRELNSDMKRCSYGPWPTYHAPYKSGYGIKWYGFRPEELHETFDGFLQFEDYPYSSAYPSHISAWGILTTKVLNEKIKIYPELYFSFPEGCPDDAVTGAYPPFGGSFCPIYFTMTQICEYVYNTPYYTKEKFGYWKDYGFSVCNFIDMPKERAKCILSLWGKIVENKPVKPLKSTVFLYDINAEGDRYDYDITPNHFYNMSESNLSYVYGIMRESGLPGGFATHFEDILTLTEKDTDCIVMPDMTYASDAVKSKIRELHSRGVMLIAVNSVTGLEDLFGVKEKSVKAKINMLYCEGDSEYVKPHNAEFYYEVTDGKVKLAVNGNIPVIISKDNTVLLNTSVGQVGLDMLAHIEYHGRPNVSRILKEILKKEIKEKIKPIAESSENTGITITETENGEKLLIITDYSRYGTERVFTAKRREIIFNTDEFSDAEYINVLGETSDMGKMYENGILRGINIMLRPHETVMFKLGELKNMV